MMPPDFRGALDEWARPEKPSVVEEIAAERRRQIEIEGWTPAHDDQHTNGELLAAANCYLRGSSDGWPWEPQWWKPKDRRHDLVRAAALAQAEHERLMRVLDRWAPSSRGDPMPSARVQLMGALSVALAVNAQARMVVERLDRAAAAAPDGEAPDGCCGELGCPVGCDPEHACKPAAAKTEGGE